MIIQDFLISHWCPSLHFSFLFHSTLRQETTQEIFTKLLFYPSPSLITKRMSQSFLSYTLSHCPGEDQNFHRGAPRRTKYLVGCTPLPGRKEIWLGCTPGAKCTGGVTQSTDRKKILGLLYGTPCYLGS